MRNVVVRQKTSRCLRPFYSVASAKLEVFWSEFNQGVFMRNDSLQQFVRIRKELNDERGRLEMRLRQINEALGEMPLPSLSPIQGATGQSTGARGQVRRGRRAAGGGQSLKDHVLAVLQEGAKTKEEVLAAVQKRGYRFSTSNPLNSLGVILYGKNPKFNRADGRFSLTGGASSSSAPAKAGRGGKRTMSPAARARIAAAQRARWAKQKGGKTEAPKAASNGASTASKKPKRTMSAAGRKAIADAARKRWAAAKAAGKKTL
jgi:hypothetical protein